MADGGTAHGPGEGHHFGKPCEFQKVFETEIGVINRRRAGLISGERGTVALGALDRPLQGQIVVREERRFQADLS